MLIINPKNNLPLFLVEDKLCDSSGMCFHIVREVPRIASVSNYTESFGYQWNKFSGAQLDRENLDISRIRFFAETNWTASSIDGKDILEVGSGAGRFSKVVLECTNATLWSVDFSDAVTANWANNRKIAPGRFNIFQASVYEMPFPENSFDKVFCLGVLQHTPDFSASIKALIEKLKPGGELVVDFYPIKGWWTKLSAKYIFRPLTKRLSHKMLMSIIERNINWLIVLYFGLHKVGLGALARFLPIVNINGTFPCGLSAAEIRELAILDTFDMFSPEFDSPQKISDVAQMFELHGAKVTFADFVSFDTAVAAVVRGIKKGTA